MQFLAAKGRYRRGLSRPISLLAVASVTAVGTYFASPAPRAEAAATPSGQLTVTVFQDFNANGTRNTTKDALFPAFDAKVAGATVRAVCVTDSGADATTGTADDTQATVTSTAQNGSGDYVLAAPGSPCRVEVTGGGLYEDGAAGATSVTFVDSVPSTVLVGINRPSDYCQDNPDIFVTCFNRHSYNLPSGRSAKTFPWSTMSDPDGNPTTTWTGNIAGPDPLADNAGVLTTYSTTGSTFGIAADVDHNLVFQSAYFKGGSAFGSGGTGAIYATNLTTNTTSVYADLNAIFGAGTAGVNTHNFASAGVANLDSAAKRDTGKTSLGDLELSQDRTKLYVSNLFDKRVYVIPTSGVVDATTVTALATPTLPSDCAVLGDLVIMGLGKDANGDIYLGGVCTGESTANNANLHSYVWKLGTGGTWSFEYSGPIPDDDTVYTPVNPGQTAITQARYWRNGSNCSLFLGAVTCPAQTVPPQYMLADIAFDGDNAMILSYRDRQNDMYTVEEANTGLINPNGSLSQNSTLNRLCRANAAGAWTLESGMSCLGTTTGPEVPAVNPVNDPVGDEYYWSDRQGDGGWESGTGGAVQIPGWPVITTTVDPQTINSDGAFVSQNRGTGGVNAFDNETGAIRGALDVLLSTSPGSFAKVNSMGDVDVMCNRAPVEIGNRLWIDTDSDGIQDPGEAPVSGVGVQLFEDADNNGVPDGAAIATVTTDANGNYIFSDDSRFSDVTGKNFGISQLTYSATDPSSNRFIIGAPTSVTVGAATYDLTDPSATMAGDPGNALGTADTWVDSDFNQTTGYTATFNTQPSGKNVHTYDGGYTLNTPKVGVGNLVWEDINNNGVVDGTEAGLNGVTVAIYADANSDGIADGAAIQTMLTDANGNYLFEGLEEGNYFITTSVPSGMVTSTGTNGADGPYETPAPDPDVTATDSDDNGSLNGSVVQSATFTLAKGTEPTGEPAMTLITPTLPDADVNQTVDFGFYHPVGVGNYVWIDVNNNGQWDTGEAPYENATMRIYEDFNNDGVPDGAALASTTTDLAGHYAFTGLIPGTYIIELVKPSGYVSSTGVNGEATGPYEGAATPDPDTTVNADTGSAGDDNGSTVGAVIRSKPITLTVGGETGDGDLNADFNPSVDFGIFQPAELGDLLWFDDNNDGQQTAGEAGVPDVNVTLYDAATNAVVKTVTTDSTGHYLFTNLIPGSYYVIFDASDPDFPDQHTFTSQDVNPDTTDSDVAPLTGKTGTYTLSAGGSNLTVDAGIYAPGPILSLGNLIWADYDDNGVVDSGEPGIAGVTVELYADVDGDGSPDGAALGQQTTNASGNYLFTGLAAGDYVVRIAQSNWNVGGPLVAWHSSSPASADPDGDVNNDDNGIGSAYAETTSGTVTLAFGAEPTNDGDVTPNANSNLSVDFGFVPDLAELGDKVWYDTNRNGIQDPAELPVVGVMVKLFRAGDDPSSATPLESTTTDASGIYLFEALNPGDYFVVFDPTTLPAGWSFTLKDAGSLDGADSDADPVTGVAIATNLVAGESDLSWDAGIVTHAAIGDYVWLDSDKDGIQDAGEPGFANVTVKLVNADTGAVVRTTTTDSSGKYLFTDVDPVTDALVAINYRIEFVAPAGYSISPRDVGTDAADSDADPSTGRTATTTLDPLEEDRTWDAGLFLTPIDFTLKKTLSGELVTGSTVDYLLQVTNAGPVDSRSQITVTDNLPEGLQYVAAAGDQWACAASGQTVTCSRTSPLAVGASSTITVQVKVVAAEGTKITNQASVSLVNDSNTTNNDDSAVATAVRGSTATTTSTTSVGTTTTTSAPGGNLPTTGTGIVRTFAMLGAAALFFGFITGHSARRTRRKLAN